MPFRWYLSEKVLCFEYQIVGRGFVKYHSGSMVNLLAIPLQIFLWLCEKMSHE